MATFPEVQKKAQAELDTIFNNAVHLQNADHHLPLLIEDLILENLDLETLNLNHILLKNNLLNISSLNVIDCEHLKHLQFTNHHDSALIEPFDTIKQVQFTGNGMLNSQHLFKVILF